MEEIGGFPLNSFDDEYLWPHHVHRSGSGSELSGSTSSSFGGVSTGGFHSDQPVQFDLSEYLLMDEASTQPYFVQQQSLVQEAISPPLMEERPRTERIAFRMKSEMEIIDDGFKWRKYGKKSVKNSPNPRNYYKCSIEGCSVKKRVERDRDDENYVITSYEGVHNHVSPSLIYYTNQDSNSGRYYVAGYQVPQCS